jgi:hypothetical protein
MNKRQNCMDDASYMELLGKIKMAVKYGDYKKLHLD